MRDLAARALVGTLLLSSWGASAESAEESKESKEPTEASQAPAAATEPLPSDPPKASAPTPARHSFTTSNAFDGKLGLGLLYMQAQPFGASTGFGQVFWQGDYDGIGGTGFSLHWDVDVRMGLFEQRDEVYVNRDGDLITRDGNSYGPAGQCEPVNDVTPPYNPSLVDPCAEPGPTNPKLGDAELYRKPFDFHTRRSYDYLRIDSLYGAWDTEWFGVALGRMIVPEASSQTVDGLNAYVSFGRLGKGGAFVGLRPNPWHQQVVGVSSGGGVDDGFGALFAPLWGQTEIDADMAERTGAYSNELGLGWKEGLPWTQLGSARFFTAGLYSSLRTEPFSVDGALVLDTFDFELDRVWAHLQGGWRIFDPLTLAFRGTLDVLGARPLMPRDLFLDLTWRDLGPFTLGATYYKVNTYATALSYAYYFRALEDPNGITVKPDDPAFPFPGDVDAPIIGANRLNNARLFVVDRDRVSLDAAMRLGGTFEVYGELIGERRGDGLYVENADPAKAADGIGDAVQGLFEGTCFFPPGAPRKPAGVNPDVPVHDDLCKVGGSMGLRDPFLADVGMLDLRFTYLDGYFQSTRRLSARVGASLRDSLWLEVGGGFEDNHNHRVYTSYSPPLGMGGGQHFITAQTTNAYLLDAVVAWRIWAGLMVEASYFGFLETVPFQGDIPVYQDPDGAAQRRDQTQVVQTFFVRTLYRF